MRTVAYASSASSLRSGPWPWTLGLVGVAHLANDAVSSTLPALFPALARRFALTPSELTLLVGIVSISTSLPQPYFGALADRLGGRRVGAIGLATSAVCVAAVAFVPSVLWLSVVLVLGGLGSAALHPAGIGLARALAARDPGPAVAFFTTMGMAGAALGPVAALALTSSSERPGLTWAAAPALVVALLFFGFAPRSARSTVHAARPSRSRRVRLHGPIARLALAALCTSLVGLVFTNAVPIWLSTVRGLGAGSPVIGWTLATFASAAAAGGMLGSVLTRWIPRRALVLGSLTTAVVALESVLVLPLGSASYFMAIAAAGVLLYVQGSILVVQAQALAPGAESAVAGLMIGGTSAAAGALYVALGVAQATFGIELTMACVFLLSIPAAWLAASVLGESERESEAAGFASLCASSCKRLAAGTCASGCSFSAA